MLSTANHLIWMLMYYKLLPPISTTQSAQCATRVCVCVCARLCVGVFFGGMCGRPRVEYPAKVKTCIHSYYFNYCRRIALEERTTRDERMRQAGEGVKGEE
ncbi:unnamed protein product [Arctogadus glacialis]